MIDKVNILHEGHCSYFAGHFGKKEASLFCIISDHHPGVLQKFIHITNINKKFVL